VGLGILLVLTLILAAFVAYFFFDVGRDDNGTNGTSVANTERSGETSTEVVGHSNGALGFPAAATRNTTRINGSDAADISVAATLASYPTSGPGSPPAAVTVANGDQWQAGVAAASLSAAPIDAPILLAPEGRLTQDGTSALTQLNPLGSPDTGENKVFTVGQVSPIPDFDSKRIAGSDFPDLAVNVANLRESITGTPPNNIVVVSGSEPGYAVPAATWSARSGDVVLYTNKDSVPKVTLDYLSAKSHKDIPVFVLGPADAVSADAFKDLQKASTAVQRVPGDDPVSAAVELARFSSGTFGWNLNDPGHGFTIVRDNNPEAAIAATSLSTGGNWPALLLTDDSDKVPEVVNDYLLDIKPGYDTDPTRALYNRIWIIGSEDDIDVNQQARIDDAAELTSIDTLQGG
jgi:hypothetical protein